MRGKTTLEARALLNLLRGGASQAAWTPYVGIMVTMPANDGVAGVEASYVGYARQAVTLDAPVDAEVPQGLQAIWNDTVEVVFPPVPADQPYEGFGLFDAASGGNLRRLSDDQSSAGTIPSGATPRFPVGELGVLED